MAEIVIDGIVKRFGSVVALNGVSLEIEKGEFFTLLGPSGCGKSTLLRTIAGFYRQDAGDLYVGGKLYNDIPPHQRNTGMVFQNYAIFPHMNVFDNIAYGLRAKKMPAAEIARRVERALAMVRLEGYEDRRPDQLSGGQKQRVVLARALVIEPRVLLMDEPLSNLDAKLRQQMRRDIRKVQQELGITTIYVTHDQEEALAVSDRIAVMQDGEVRQLDSPDAIYKDPAHPFVADFIGSTNFLRGPLVRMGNGALGVQLGQGVFLPLPDVQASAGDELVVSVRPEHIRLRPLEAGGVNGASGSHGGDGAPGRIPGRVELVSFLGSRVMVEVRVPVTDTTVEVELRASDSEGLAALAFAQPGRDVVLEMEPAACIPFDARSGRRVDR